MGNKVVINYDIQPLDTREVFVGYKSMKCIKSGLFGNIVVFTFTVRYRRFKWDIFIRFNEVVALDRKLVKEFPLELQQILRPAKQSKLFWTHDDAFLQERAKIIAKYLQDLLDKQLIFTKSKAFRKFLNVSDVSFNPDLGKKSKEGYLLKCSGGYLEKFSNKAGDYFNFWRWRWFVLSDSCISWYRSPEDKEPKGSLQIDQGFHFITVNRVISIYTSTRKLVVQASTKRAAEEWVEELKRFYQNAPRTTPQAFGSSYPPRFNADVKVYTYTKDYMSALAVCLLNAQKEILITSWKNSPGVLLTRPPFPPLRLDQLLKYKADQGVQIYVLLYKEVDYVGQGNDSLGSKTHLEKLSKNIHCIRHPNKLFGGSTALLWSHHEKLVIIDRNMAFLGGVDLAYQRWDDEYHRVADEDGLIFPGNDYRQPAPGLFKPVRAALPTSPILNKNGQPIDDDDDEIEVEIAVPGESLPVAMTTALGEDEPYEVEVVVDFGVAQEPTTWSPFTTSNLQNNNRLNATSNNSSNPTSPSTVASSKTSNNNNNRSNSNALNSPESKGIPPDEEGGDEVDRMSDVSENWAEDRFVPETKEENEAKRNAEAKATGTKQQRDDDEVSIANSEVDRSTVNRGSTFTSIISGVKQTRSSIAQTFDYFASQFRAGYEQATTKRVTKKSGLEIRDTHPRMPWHDVQAVVTGSAARDIASHFVQRWNHHRLSTSSHGQPVMRDITDDLLYSTCAKCQSVNLLETLIYCKCGYYLGPTNSYSMAENPNMVPLTPDPHNYSYLVFEMKYSSTLPFKVQGDCPVVITALLHKSKETSADCDTEGNLVDIVGPMGEWLNAFGLVPAVGDVVLAVDNMIVTHLNSNQFKRLIKRKRLANKSVDGETFISITLRRHYLENIHPVDKKYETLHDLNGANNNTTSNDNIGAIIDDAGAIGGIQTSEAIPIDDHQPFSHILGPNSIINNNNSAVPVKSEFMNRPQQFNGQQTGNYIVEDPDTVPDVPFEYDITQLPIDNVTPSFSGSGSNNNNVNVVTPSSPQQVNSNNSSSNNVSNVAVVTPIRDPEATLGKSGMSHSSSNNNISGNNNNDTVIPAVPLNAAGILNATPIDQANNTNTKDKKTAEEFHPACKAAAHQEISLAMSQLFHQYARHCDIPRRIADNTGTCKVQVLRSVGKWSIGTKTENSIMTCWIESITNAQNFVYIENQFFIGNNSGNDVQNAIPSAIVERILLAFSQKQQFKVIIVIPMHPNGDYANAMKSKHVMHFQYQTINRGVSSMFTMLRHKAPGINISDYISFHSLRNWGVMNNKVVSDQVYIHDKLLIVDDRVVIIGSANINDRSMLGYRDSEMAIRIEDTLHLDVLFNGVPYTVGYLPHTLRMKLMKQHVMDDTFDLSDPVSKATIDRWKYISNKNSSIYDEIDGNLSMYRTTTLSEYNAAFQQHNYKSYLDPGTRTSLSEIQGFLVDFPQNLFKNEDLSPSMATRAVIPNDLWV